MSYIGQEKSCRFLPIRRNHTVQEVRIAVQRMLNLSVDDHERPEIFLRNKSADCSSELIGLYYGVGRVTSVALRYGAPLEKVGDLLSDAQSELCGPVF
ncbi:MAG: hypothetical protein ABI955_05585, partial [Nitrospirota bacterium]